MRLRPLTQIWANFFFENVLPESGVTLNLAEMVKFYQTELIPLWAKTEVPISVFKRKEHYFFVFQKNVKKKRKICVLILLIES